MKFEPVYIFCEIPEDIPTSDAIRNITSYERYVVLQFPERLFREHYYDKKNIIRNLTDQLVDFYVFDSGYDTGIELLTIKKALSIEIILNNINLILESIRTFQATARELTYTLAQTFGVQIESFADKNFKLQFKILNIPFSGSLQESEWGYFFHGFGCAFMHKIDGRILEVKLGFDDEFGVLDPYFFHKFLSTAPSEYETLALFRNDPAIVARTFAVLLSLGYLKIAKSKTNNQSGLILA